SRLPEARLRHASVFSPERLHRVCSSLVPAIQFSGSLLPQPWGGPRRREWGSTHLGTRRQAKVTSFFSRGFARHERTRSCRRRRPPAPAPHEQPSSLVSPSRPNAGPATASPMGIRGAYGKDPGAGCKCFFRGSTIPQNSATHSRLKRRRRNAGTGACTARGVTARTI